MLTGFAAWWSWIALTRAWGLFCPFGQHGLLFGCAALFDNPPGRPFGEQTRGGCSCDTTLPEVVEEYGFAESRGYGVSVAVSESFGSELRHGNHEVRVAVIQHWPLASNLRTLRWFAGRITIGRR